MKKPAGNNLIQKLSSVMMILALAWLTISAPFIYSSQQEGKNLVDIEMQADNDVEDCPINNSSEEKAPSSGTNTLSEEYLHDHDHLYHVAELLASHARFHSVSEYIAFHGELLTPPPNEAIS